MNKKAFTLVELVVIVIILAILWTISFISFYSYNRDARDWVRVSDVNNIINSLNIYEAKTSYYPEPSFWVNITYSGWEVWNQWTIWESVYLEINNLDKLPVDPLTWDEYTYSRLNTNKEFEIATILEWNKRISFINKANALSKKSAIAYVKWNYNWKVAKVETGTLTYVLAIPTIISWDIDLTDIIELINWRKLVYNWYSNLPSSYNWSEFETTPWLDYIPNKLIVYTWSLEELKTNENQRMLLIENIKENYDWTLFANQANISNIIDTQVEFSNPSKQAKDLWEALVENDLWLYVKTLIESSSNTSTTTTTLTWSEVYYAKSIWSAWQDSVESIATDSNWNTYITWYYEWTLDIFWEQTLNWYGEEDIFLIKLDIDWNIIWAKRAWGSGEDLVKNVYVDQNDDVFLVWRFRSNNIDLFWQSFSSNWNIDWYITKFDPDWNVLLNHTYGWNWKDEAKDIVTDSSWNIYITWTFSHSNVDLFWEVFSSSAWLGLEWFIAKLDSNLNRIRVKSSWTDQADWWTLIRVDNLWNVFLVWNFDSWNRDIYGINKTWLAQWDTYLAKFDSDWNTIWVNIAWSDKYDEWEWLEIDSSGNLYYAYWVWKNPIYLFWNNLWTGTIIISKLDNNWNIIWTKTTWTQLKKDMISSMISDSSWNLYVSWWKENWTNSIFWEAVSPWNKSTFAKISQSDGSTSWVKVFWNTNWRDESTAIWVDNNWNVYASWPFYSNATILWQDLTSHWWKDIFLVKLNSSWGQ